MAERAGELEARLEGVRSQAADHQEEALQSVRDRLANLESDLQGTRAVNARLRAEMTELVSFLDELNGVLSAATP